METTEKEVYGKGLTLRVWVLIFITIIVQISTTLIQHTMANMWLYANGLFPLAPTLVILFFHNLLPSRWRLSKQELTLLVAVGFFNASSFYFLGGYVAPYHGAQLIPGLGPISAAYIKSIDPYKQTFGGFVPDWMASSGNIQPIISGGVLDWVAWTPAILFWFLIYVVYFLFGALLVFSLRKPFIETERLIFPQAMGTIPLFDYQIEKDGGKRVKLLNFSSPEAKAFWIGSVVGIIMGASDVLNYFLPAIPPSSEFAGNYINLTGVFQQYLPGAFGSTWLWWVDIPIYCFASLDVTLTCIIFNIFFFIVYPAVAVRLGWVSYVPGVEATADSQYGLVEGPFKFLHWANYGLMFGIGLWVAWNCRKHLINILQNAFGKATGASEEGGVSYRFVGLGIIVLWILMLILWTVVGMPPFVAFTGLVLLVVYTLGSSRTRAEAYIENANVGSVEGWLYDAGYATGSWGPAPYVSNGLFKTMYISPGITSGNLDGSGMSPSYQLHIWKMAYETKTDPKDVMKMIIVTTIFTFIFANVFGLWWYSKIGGVTTSPGYTAYSDLAAGSESYTLNTGQTLTALERVWYAVTGVIFVFGCFFLRARFPWFFIHPVGVWTATLSCCHLWPPIIGFIYKYVIMKVGGTRLWERVGIPGVIGFLTLQTLGSFFFIAWIGFFTISLPAAMPHF